MKQIYGHKNLFHSIVNKRFRDCRDDANDDQQIGQ